MSFQRILKQVSWERLVREMEQGSLVVPAGILGGLLMVGLIAGGAILGSKVRDFKRADRYFEVKGLVERTVKSDAATWSLSFSEAGETLPAIFTASEKDKDAVMQFLSSQGFGPESITVEAPSVTDRSAQQFNSEMHGPRFVVQRTVTVQSRDVDRVAAASGKTGGLIASGVVLSSGQGPMYKFNGLNILKPDMITEATRNARASADRFAADSGSQVGSIRSANQGVFSISAAAAGPAVDEGGGFSAEQQADASVMKKVRVVATIDYYLVN